MRKAKEGWNWIQVQVRDAEKDALEAYCEATGRSKTDVLRDFMRSLQPVGKPMESMSLEELFSVIPEIKSYNLIWAAPNEYHCFINSQLFAQGTREELAARVRDSVQQGRWKKVFISDATKDLQDLPDGWEADELSILHGSHRGIEVRIYPEFLKQFSLEFGKQEESKKYELWYHGKHHLDIDTIDPLVAIATAQAYINDQLEP
jgi:hypothetical protein